MWSTVLISNAFVHHTEDEGLTAVVQADYVEFMLTDVLEQAVEVTIPKIKEAYRSFSTTGRVEVEAVVGNGRLIELQLFYSDYSPLGVRDIPVGIIQRQHLDTHISASRHYRAAAERVRHAGRY